MSMGVDGMGLVQADVAKLQPWTPAMAAFSLTP